MKLELTTAPANITSWISTSEAVDNVFGDETADEVKIFRDIQGAYQRAEQYTERAFVTQSWTMKLDVWPKNLIVYLPKGKIQSITSLNYLDENNASQPLVENTNFYLENTGDVARIIPDDSWPDLTTERLGAVTIVFVAGYGDAVDLGVEYDHIKDAILLDVGMLYEIRQSLGNEEIHSNKAYEMMLHREKIYFDFHSNNAG